MTILITGGSGFIGGHLAEHFVRGGHNVVVLDTLNPFYHVDIKKKNIETAVVAAEDGDGEYQFIRGNVTNQDLVERIVSDVEYVFHHAAQAGVRASVENPQRTMRTNVQGTFTLLEAAREADIERFVNASSSSVYGKPEYLPYDEAHPTTPVSPYGASKLAAEHYVRVYNEVYKLPSVSLRYFTVYGPRMRPNMAFTNFVSRSIHAESPIIYGDGNQTRDFTYVGDVVDANRRLLDTDAADGEVLNIGSTDRIMIEELARVIRDEIDPTVEIVKTDRREGDTKHTHADVSKANELIGYEPKISIEEGANNFIQWYRRNIDWYDELVQRSK